MRLPDGCPEFTKALLAKPEKEGPKWLPGGRAALIDGVLRCTVPGQCCKIKFRSGLLGLTYRRLVAIENNEEEKTVVVDWETASVEILQEPLPDEDSDDDADRQRFPKTTSFRHYAYPPLIQTREKAMEWDAEIAKLPDPTGPGFFALTMLPDPVPLTQLQSLCRTSKKATKHMCTKDHSHTPTFHK